MRPNKIGVSVGKKMKTVKFFVTLGVIAGYGHGNKQNFFARLFGKKNSSELIAGKAWQTAAATVFATTGTYIGSVITPSKTVYNEAWGCPKGGEDTVLITGECNPEYTKLADYKSAVVETLRQTALALGQSTTQLCFLEAEFEYLDFRPKTEA